MAEREKLRPLLPGEYQLWLELPATKTYKARLLERADEEIELMAEGSCLQHRTSANPTERIALEYAIAQSKADTLREAADMRQFGETEEETGA